MLREALSDFFVQEKKHEENCTGHRGQVDFGFRNGT